MTPQVEGKSLNQSLLLTNLDVLNKKPGGVFLTSKDNVESRPEWLHSHVGIPKSGFDVSQQRYIRRVISPQRPSWHSHSTQPFGKDGISRRDQKPITGTATEELKLDGYSEAPAVLILVDKGSGIVDAFWFFFYSYNLGQTVLNIRFGNHVGDWEYCMVRFEQGAPRGIFMSEHAGGQAYSYSAVEKRNARPVLYSAVGSHAIYPNPGDHPYVLPFNMLKDVTDQGPLWDPAQNTYSYWYDPRNNTGKYNQSDFGHVLSRNTSDSLIPTAENPSAPTSWFHYVGAWGDNIYSLADRRQWRLFNQYHYDEGPYGPKLKGLDREQICPTDQCEILETIIPGQTWYGKKTIGL
ncbi:vacuolar protein sorting-associated protein TDA6-like protein 2 [Colletotrichum truncatum]|uniref:Vacuolar protein sorting-associated protein TDA6-like protein 2 n=1 Tax=Colletotrichum truncatum TaxID=5467 RepID=A0ACC3YKW0_COLTU